MTSFVLTLQGRSGYCFISPTSLLPLRASLFSNFPINRLKLFLCILIVHFELFNFDFELLNSDSN